MLLETELCLRRGHFIDECCRDLNFSNLFPQVKVYVSIMLVLQKHVNLYV